MLPPTCSKRLRAAMLLLALSWHCGRASALGLMQACEAALVHDPDYQSALYDYEAGRQARALGRAGLLPTVSASIAAGRNHATYAQSTALGTEIARPHYDSRADVLSVRQPLVDAEGLARYRQGEAQANYSEAQFASRRQELLLRVTTAYLSILLAEDQLALAVAQRDALVEQRRVNDSRLRKGDGTRTDVLETAARLDLAEAQLIEAQDSLAAARHTLAGMVGGEPGRLDRWPGDFHYLEPASLDIDQWTALALEHNPELAALRFAVEAAEQEIRKAVAGHYPSLELVAGYSKSKGASVTSFDQGSTVRSVGLQLNIPLYAGGRVSAASAQATANRKRAQAELDAATNRMRIELRKQFDLTRSGSQRLAALDQAVASARLLVRATEHSVRGGLRVNLDVLNAQQQLFTAQHDRAQAGAGFLLAWLRLRSTAGTLSNDDLLRVAAGFVARR